MSSPPARYGAVAFDRGAWRRLERRTERLQDLLAGIAFFPIKSQEQQCLLVLHRIRDRLLAERTASINAIRGHLAEFGIVAAQGARWLGELS